MYLIINNILALIIHILLSNKKVVPGRDLLNIWKGFF